MADLISPLNLGTGAEKRGKEKARNRIGANASIGHRRHAMWKEGKARQGVAHTKRDKTECYLVKEFLL